MFSVKMPEWDAELGGFAATADLGPRKTMLGHDGLYVDPCTDDPPTHRPPRRSREA